MKSLVILCSLFCLSRAFSCTCTKQPSLEDEVARSAAIFTGRVVVMQVVSVENHDMVLVGFKPEHFYVGSGSEKIWVLTGMGRGDCGFRFRLDEKYVVFAYAGRTSKKHSLETDICTRTEMLGNRAYEPKRELQDLLTTRD
jgi:hypothetical protein